MTEASEPGHGEPGHGHDQIADSLSAGVPGTTQALFAAGSETDTLRQIVLLAVEGVEGCDHASVFLVAGDKVSAPASSDRVARELDTLQQHFGEGPCLEVIRQSDVIYADDLVGASRWTSFGPAAIAAGVRSILSLRLEASETLGALNLYATYPQAFGVMDRARALILATLASHAVAAARSHKAEEDRAEHLTSALLTRETIGQAQGILMERERISADQAFDVLRRASQRLNIKLRDVAQNLVETGENPSSASPTPPSPPPAI
jgi:GAF domain-containing protein